MDRVNKSKINKLDKNNENKVNIIDRERRNVEEKNETNLNIVNIAKALDKNIVIKHLSIVNNPLKQAVVKKEIVKWVALEFLFFYSHNNFF